MSAELRAERTAEPRISYFTFFLRGLEDGADPQAASAAVSARKRWTVLAGPGGAVFRCGTTDHRPLVRTQVWSAEPPPPGGEWDTQETVRFALHTEGRVQLNEWDGYPAGDVLDLGSPGTYALRAARRMTPSSAGMEDWLLQLWPA
ncbi:hypothetical protein [Streptomyces sp. NPDC002851]